MIKIWKKLAVFFTRWRDDGVLMSQYGARPAIQRPFVQRPYDHGSLHNVPISNDPTAQRPYAQWPSVRRPYWPTFLYTNGSMSAALCPTLSDGPLSGHLARAWSHCVTAWCHSSAQRSARGMPRVRTCVPPISRLIMLINILQNLRFDLDLLVRGSNRL